jgi:hypothetical protein
VKKTILFLLYSACFKFGYAQQTVVNEELKKKITFLIDQYSQAREKRDTALLKSILTSNVDQLVSTGEWRTGINAAIEGMMRSSANSPGTRRLVVEKIQGITAASAIVDCRYEIKNADGSTRKMWSTFIVVEEKGVWKIMSIRNMLPAAAN